MQKKIFYCNWIQWFCTALLATALPAVASSRFPKPQFETDYVPPATSMPAPEFVAAPLLDLLILFGALCVAVLLVRRIRSRRWILLFGLICLLWFGFVRKGCFCPVGAIQNVAVAAFHGGGVPYAIALFFALPLIFALFYGRVFCSVVCPLGALQEFFIVKPLRVPGAIDAVLRIVPLLVLCLGVVCAVNGAGFMICRTDPFVGIFRQTGALPMLLTGMGVLLMGTVVARPYCRYFCPYGVLLEFCSIVAWKPVQIAEGECVNCRLCVGMCPVDAIESPRPEPSDRIWGRQFQRFINLLIMLPLLIITGAAAGYFSGGAVAHLHPVVKMVEDWRSVPEKDHDLYPEIEVFKRRGHTLVVAEKQAAVVIKNFRKGCMLSGIFIATVLGFRMLMLSRLARLKVHQAGRTRCVACGRCFGVCPSKAKG
jgi:NosR/NirI family transcriptional regulator, nitrous oxide reductase regulator